MVWVVEGPFTPAISGTIAIVIVISLKITILFME